MCLISKGSKYSSSNYLKPELTKSNLNFANFYWEQKENKVYKK
jgi:hypothetical protein